MFYRLVLEEMKKGDMLIAKNLCIVRAGAAVITEIQ